MKEGKMENEDQVQQPDDNAPQRGDEEFQAAQEEHQERTDTTEADNAAERGLDQPDPVSSGVDDQSAGQPPEVTGEQNDADAGTDQTADTGD